MVCMFVLNIYSLYSSGSLLAGASHNLSIITPIPKYMWEEATNSTQKSSLQVTLTSDSENGSMDQLNSLSTTSEILVSH